MRKRRSGGMFWGGRGDILMKVLGLDGEVVEDGVEMVCVWEPKTSSSSKQPQWGDDVGILSWLIKGFKTRQGVKSYRSRRRRRRRGRGEYRRVEVWAGLLFLTCEVGIYKRKQESKKTGNKIQQELDQESDQEKKKAVPFFLGRFLGRDRVFFLYFICFSWLLSWSKAFFSSFLVFFYKFPPLSP